MDILLTAATKLEIQPTIDFLEHAGFNDGHGFPGSFGLPVGAGVPGGLCFHLGSHRIDVLLTGVGAVATTWQLSRQFVKSRPDLILQGGIAGCFTGRKNGEVVAVDEEIFADLGVWETGGFKTLFDMGLADPNSTPFENGLLANPFRALLSASGLETVRSLCVNEITTSAERIAWYQQNWSPVVESLEGGALHYVCINEQIPFLQLRAISNQVGDRDKTRWDFAGSIGSLNKKLIALLKELPDLLVSI